jgi:hypothetical protein
VKDATAKRAQKIKLQRKKAAVVFHFKRIREKQSGKIPGLRMHETVSADECAGCFRPIRDRFLLKVLDKPWHAGCVRCELCRKPLDEKCFYKEGKMYCKDDFYRFEHPPS